MTNLRLNFFKALRWIFYGLLLFLSAVLLLLRSVSNYSEGYAEETLAALSERLGVSIEARSLDIEWRGLSPQITIDDLTIGEAPYQSTVGYIQFKLNMLSTLKNRAPIWSWFSSSNSRIVFVAQPGGDWTIAGINFGSGDSSSLFVEKMLLQSNRVELNDSEFYFHSLRDEVLTLGVKTLTMYEKSGFRRVVMNAEVGDSRNTVQWVSEFTGNASRFSQLDGKGFLNIDIGNNEAIGGQFLQRLGVSSFEDFSLKTWLNFSQTTQPEFQSELYLSSLQLMMPESNKADIDITAVLQGRATTSHQQVVVSHFNAFSQNKTHSLPDFSIFAKYDSEFSLQRSWELQIPQLDLTLTYNQLRELQLIPSILQEPLSALALEGQLQGLKLTVVNSDLRALRATATIADFAMQSFKKAPALKGISGRVHTGLYEGSIQLDKSPVGILLSPLYLDWITSKELAGDVSWKFDKDFEYLALSSSDILAEVPQGMASGGFKLGIPLLVQTSKDEQANNSQNGQREGSLDLLIKLEGAKVTDQKRLIPQVVPEFLRHWLNRSALSGDVPVGVVAYRGPLKKSKKYKATVQVKVKVENAELAFLDRWSIVQNIEGEVWVSDNEVWGQSSFASMQSLELSDTKLHIYNNNKTSNSQTDNQTLLTIDGHYSGDTNEALDIIRHSSLRDQLGDSLDILQFQGTVAGDISLQLPLTKNVQEEDVLIHNNAWLNGNELTLEPINIKLTEINAAVHYDSATGISSKGLNAELWNQPIKMDLKESELGDEIQGKITGQVATKQLWQWLGLDLNGFVDGTTSFTSKMAIPIGRAERISNMPSAEDRPIRLEISSDLQGVNVSLPDPFKKTPEKKTPFVLNAQLQPSTGALDVNTEKQHQFDLSWASQETQAASDVLETREIDQFQAQFLQPLEGKGFTAMSLAMNAELKPLQTGLLLGDFNTTELDAKAWYDSIDELTIRFFDKAEPVEDRGLLLGLMLKIQLAAQHVHYADVLLGAVNGSVISAEQQLVFSADNHFFDAQWQPNALSEQGLYKKLAIKHFDLDQYLANNPSTDSQSDTQAALLKAVPAMHISIDELIYEAAARGRWKAQAIPTDNGLMLDNIEGGLHSAQIDVSKGASSVVWDGEKTQAKLNVAYENVADLFALLALESSISSESGTAETTMEWSGTPLGYETENVVAFLNVHAKNGVIDSDKKSINRMLKTVGLINIGSWARRLRLDFKDISSKGLAYNKLDAQLYLENARLTTVEPAHIKLPSGIVKLDGGVDLATDALDAKLTVTLPARQNLTWVAAITGGLPTAFGVWLVGLVFGDKIDDLSSVNYKVTGNFDNMNIETLKKPRRKSAKNKDISVR